MVAEGTGGSEEGTHINGRPIINKFGLVFGMALCFWVGSAAVTPEGRAMDGLAALRRGNVEAAEAKFRHEGNDLRTAECLILQGKLDAASVLCEPIDSPASLRMRAIIARKRGDDAAAGALWQQAAERGDEVAKAVLALGGAAHD